MNRDSVCIVAMLAGLAGCAPRSHLPSASATAVVAVDDSYLAIDGVRASGEHPTVVLDVGRAFGWRVHVVTKAAEVTWREELTLPGPAKTWGHGASNTDPTRHVTSMTSIVQTDGWIHHEWVVADGDPIGEYRIRIYLNDDCVADLAFDGTAGNPETPKNADTIRAGHALGSLDPAKIDERIKRSLTKIQYCFEDQLPTKPHLAGKIVIHFVIEADGSVSSAGVRSTTMNDDIVEQCIVHRFLEIRFPKPSGDGIVTVNYPLLFKNS